MNEIGEYGEKKYAEKSFHARAQKGDFSRGQHADDRTSTVSLRHHAQQHFFDYYYKTKHDHFGTLEHQLAAVAFNAMMEYYFAQAEKKEGEK